MEETATIVRTADLEALVTSLMHQASPAKIRYRTFGNLWYPNFLKILSTEGRNILFLDERRDELIHLSNLSHVIEFELSAKSAHFEPHCHYEVALDPQYSITRS